MKTVESRGEEGEVLGDLEERVQYEHGQMDSSKGLKGVIEKGWCLVLGSRVGGPRTWKGTGNKPLELMRTCLENALGILRHHVHKDQSF